MRRLLFLFILATLVFLATVLAGCTGAGPDNGAMDGPGPAQTTPGTARPGDLLRVHYLDVGQGDAMLLEFPSGQTMLIDAGNHGDGDLVVDYIKARGLKHINHIIGTHPHSDHIGGLGTVLQHIAVDHIYMPKVTHNTGTYRDLLLTIQQKGLKITTARGGLELEVGSGTRALLLSPLGEDYEGLNDFSAVLQVTHGALVFLFTGDAEARAEAKMLEAGYNLKADVLKAGHHGSNSSTTENFLQAVAPRYAVISCGKDNDYGHPHAEVLDRLTVAGIQVLRTDLEGTLVAVSDGQTLRWEHQRDTATGNPRVEITAIDLIDEVAVVVNRGQEPVDLAGWVLVSTKGDQRFVFPQDTVLPPGESLAIVSGPNAAPAPATLVWTRENIWNNQGDPGELYDARGTIISRYPR